MVVNTRWFPRNEFFNWVPARDYPYEVTGANADVVIFGDSSALAGIDPLLMQKELGVSVVNLSPILRSMYVMQDKPLQAYLRHNAPPKIIVVYVVPWHTGMPVGEASADGMLVMMRHDTPGHALMWVARHPVQALTGDVYLANLILANLRRPLTDSGHDAVWRNHGFFPYPGDRPHMQPGCSIDPQNASGKDIGAWPQLLARRYQTAQTRVVLYLAPTPDCRGAEEFRRIADGVNPRPINQWSVLPPGIFIDDTFDAHPEERNVPITTRMLIDALRPLLAERPPA